MKTNKSYLLITAVLISLFSLTPTHAQTNGDIVDRLNKTLGVRLPAEFEAKVKEFAANDTIMRTRSATAFTEQFIIEQFKNDWGIDRQHQLLFMWDVIYTQISEKELYDWLDDDNEVRFDNYKKQLNTLIQFEENYKKGFKEYMEQKSAEYDRQSAEARKQSAEAERMSAEAERMSAEAERMSAEAERMSAEARRQSAEAIKHTIENTKEGLKGLVKFYNIYKSKPQIVKASEIEQMKVHFNFFMDNCKKFNIDYKAILRKELGDEKKVKEMLKFYGIE